MQTQLKPARYHTLDVFRGLLVLMMVLYHVLWDMKYLFWVYIPWFGTGLSFFWQQCICWSFILLSGFCFPLSRKKWRRGLTVFGASAAVSLATMLFMPESTVLFGVLFLLGSAMLIQALLNKLLCKWNPWAGLGISAALFFLTYNVNAGSLGFLELSFCPLPGFLYQNHLTAALGFPHDAFYSTDYFSLIPWIFLFQAGYFLHGLCKRYDLLPFLSGRPIQPFAFIGRHSLLIYILHQPVVYGILWLVLGSK